MSRIQSTIVYLRAFLYLGDIVSLFISQHKMCICEDHTMGHSWAGVAAFCLAHLTAADDFTNMQPKLSLKTDR